MNDHFDNLSSSLGKMIQSKRKAKELTQEVVAKALGINRATLANLEAGDHRILMVHLFELCMILDLDLMAIYELYKSERMKAEFSNMPNELKIALDSIIDEGSKI